MDFQVDLCDPDPCAEGRICVDKGNNYSCDCPPTYTGPQCTQPIRAVKLQTTLSNFERQKKYQTFFFLFFRYAAAIPVITAEPAGEVPRPFTVLALLGTQAKRASSLCCMTMTTAGTNRRPLCKWTDFIVFILLLARSLVLYLLSLSRFADSYSFWTLKFNFFCRLHCAIVVSMKCTENALSIPHRCCRAKYENSTSYLNNHGK